VLASLFYLLQQNIQFQSRNELVYLDYYHLVFFISITLFIKVFITDRFMNKNWESEQLDRL
jgi:hypothetical protein